MRVSVCVQCFFLAAAAAAALPTHSLACVHRMGRRRPESAGVPNSPQLYTHARTNTQKENHIVQYICDTIFRTHVLIGFL